MAEGRRLRRAEASRPRGTDVLVLGSGGREHALAHFLGRSPKVGRMYAAPGNAGMADRLELDAGRQESWPGLVRVVRERGIDLVVVGPELPLCLGLVDFLSKEGIRVFGPGRAAARLEGDKAFARDFMARHGIPQPRYAVFAGWEEARAHLEELPEGPVVVKASGLAGGKGAVVCESRAQALETARQALLDRAFGAAGETLVIEEFMEGEEASVFAVCDGREARYLPAAQDHKRALDGDLGPNTGGMGAYAPAPLVTPRVLERVDRQIVQPVLRGMAGEGSPYRGCLYVGLMIQDGAPRVVEFNCRFGDPETQAVLPLLEEDLYELLSAAADGSLDRLEPAPAPAPGRAACCVVLASGGYPGAYEKGKPIEGLERFGDEADLFAFHAGTARDAAGRVITAGGRVLGVTGVGDSIERAVERAYAGAERIRYAGMYYRKDIGHRAVGRRTS